MGEAAALYDGKNSVQTQSYGPESRGGKSRAEVIISDQEIDFPKVTEPDVLLVMTQEAMDSYHRDLKPGGVVVCDTEYVKRVPAMEAKVYPLPLTAIARETTGREIAANMVALGALVALAGVCDPESARKALERRVPRGTEGPNLAAFQAGLRAGEEALKKAAADPGRRE